MVLTSQTMALWLSEFKSRITFPREHSSVCHLQPRWPDFLGRAPDLIWHWIVITQLQNSTLLTRSPLNSKVLRVKLVIRKPELFWLLFFIRI